MASRIARCLLYQARNQLVLAGTDCAADIAYSDWRPVAIGDDQVGVLVGLKQLSLVLSV